MVDVEFITLAISKKRFLFPQFTIYSTPLLILVLQGLIFAFLLMQRYIKKRVVADLLITLLLILMAYHRTIYTIGFMGWFDTFTNTKVNYYVVSLGLALGPLIYLYVRTTVQAPFKLKRRDALHFVPVAIYFLYRMMVLLYDSSLDGWETGYEGEWQQHIHFKYVAPIYELLVFASQLLYYTFSIQLFLKYRDKIKDFFSNTYRVELNWIRNFLAIYILLFVYDSITMIINAFIIDLDYKHVWWVHFFSAIAIVYLGIKAYFTDFENLHNETFDLDATDQSIVQVENLVSYDREKRLIERELIEHTAYMNNELTLKDLAKATHLSLHQVSETINRGYKMNFNELINRYRIDEVKKRLIDPQYDHLSLVAIAFDCGFNSKATFNRVFKTITGVSPSDFKASLKK